VQLRDSKDRSVCVFIWGVGYFQKHNEGYSPSTKGVSIYGIAAIPVVSTYSDTLFCGWRESHLRDAFSTQNNSFYTRTQTESVVKGDS
jgi:hypothetical protein